MVSSVSTGSSSAPTPPTVSVAISELEVLKLILEFLEHRRLHIAQLALERETGLINGQYTDDVLFLRQLILDGQWDSALDFVEPLKELEGFQARNYRFLITKYKYFELLCIKQEPGPLQDNEFTVEEIVECLRELERLCESAEEFRQLCALLTLPKLSDHEHFRNWNPSSARVECFHAILPIVADYIDRLNPPKEQQAQNEQPPEHSEAERLLQLLVKGLLYESAVDYCQAQALEGKNAPKPKCKFTKLLAHRGKLSPTDLSLISWLEVLGNEQFTTPFQQKTLDFRLDPLKKPKLEAQWTEQILATPIKPGGQFPYSLVPHTKLKSAQKQLLMSQSMSASMAFEPGFHGARQRSSSRPTSYPMSQSTFPSITAFSIQQLNIEESEGKGGKALGEDVMRQSQIISDMLSESSAPSTARRSSLSNEANSARGERERHIDKSKSLSLASSPPISTGEGAAAARQELDAFTRRNQLQPLPLNQQRGATAITAVNVNPSMAAAVPVLPSVPELSTPGGTGALPTAFPQQPLPAEIPPQMVQSRLFQEFQANRQQQQVQAVQQQPPFPMAHPQMVYMPVQQDYQMQYPPAYQMPSTAVLSMPPIAEHYVHQQNPHFQPVHPQPPQVMMRQHNEVPFSQNNFVPPAPPMSSRPTSMIIPSNQMQHSMMAQGQPNAGRPRSFLDQPFPPAPEQSQQPSSATSYSMMTTIPVGDHRKGSFGDEEFPDRGTDENSNESAGVDEPPHNTGDGTPKPLQFVPICRYEDAQAIRAVAFHPSGGHFAIGTNSRQLLLCRYPELNGNRRGVQEGGTPSPPEVLLTRPKHHRGSVYCAAFSQTGELLATGSNDKTIRLLAVQMDANRCRIGAELELQHVHDGTVRDLIFMEERLSAGGTPSSVLISGGAGNCQLCVTDCAVGRTMKAFQGHTAPILGLNSWGSSTNFVSCSQDKTIRFWDLRASGATSIIWPTKRTSNSPVTSVCVDPSGKLLVSGHEDASIMLFDICGGRPVQLFRPHGDEVRTVRLSNAAYYLLSGSYDKRIVITDMRGNLAEPLAWLPVAEHGDKVIQCRWHPRDFLFLSTSADKSAVLWSLPAQ